MSDMNINIPEAETVVPIIKFYWKDGSGFYRTDVHSAIPDGSYEITEERYTELLQACDGRHIVVTSEDGSPVLAEVRQDAGAMKRNTAEARIKEMLREKELNQVCELIADNDDAAVLDVAPAFPEWKAGKHYMKGRILNHKGKVYRTVIEVNSLVDQPPGSAGMAAVYRPVDPDQNAGTQADSIPGQYEMDVEDGKYYSWKGKTYLAKANMPACIWRPGSEGVWQWEEMADASRRKGEGNFSAL